ncbi:hypothetical protein ACA910_015141 [Epithemia clementina (nom. ined.)]
MAPMLRKRRVKAASASNIVQEQNREEERVIAEQDGPSNIDGAGQEESPRPSNNASKEEQANSIDGDRDHGDETYYRITPLIQVSSWRRLDVGPCALLSLLFVLADHFLKAKTASLSVDDTVGTETYATAQSWVSLAYAVTLLCQISLVVGAQWSLAWKVAVGYRVVAPKIRRKEDKTTSSNTHPTKSDQYKTNNINNSQEEYETEQMRKWTHCYVQPIRSSSSSGGLERSGISLLQLSSDGKQGIVNFQDHIFRYCPRMFLPDGDVALWNTIEKPPPISNSDNAEAETKPTATPKFRPLFYPVNLPLSFYASWKGHSSLAQINQASSIYGPNQTLIQLPSFWELLSEQLIAPFFLFQVFCVLLWSLDEYWYYAIFTLCALILFESTLAYNRQQSLQRLHHAGNTNSDQRIWVRRTLAIGSIARPTSWMLLPKAELVPGDFVSLSVKSVEGTPVPADIVVMQGSAVCDEALLTGESVPQLKQALDTTITKQDNGSNGEASPEARLDLQDSLHKESILFGGTKLLVANASDALGDENDSPPGGFGVTGIILRTGFETAQGNLLRTMAHSARTTDGIHTWDTFVFILLLVGCALAAAAVVLKEGWNDERRNRFKLCLHVIIIVTSVVPPELPMELSLAVTNSVAALVRRCKVYCSELFRIPWAGEVNVCCFDKTGTLTSDEMRLRGVRLPTLDDPVDEETALKSPLHDSSFPRDTIRVMIACHSLTPTGGPPNRSKNNARLVVGDPLEQAVLNKTGYQLLGNNIVATESTKPQDGNDGKPMTILHRFAFSSKLKRMTILAAEGSGSGSGTSVWALSKGAPETMKQFLTNESLPRNYDAIAFHHMSHGRRVLAMASRRLSSSESKNLKQLIQGGRDKIETKLDFVGFLVLDCPLKPDSKSVIAELSKSGHFSVMITGDALLTAVEVARQVGILSSSSSASPSYVVYTIQPRCPTSLISVAGAESNSKEQEGTTTMTEFECVDVSGVSEERLSLSRDEIPKLQRLQRDGLASFSISGDVLIRIAQSVVIAGDKSSFWNDASLSTNKEKSILLHPAAQEFLSQLAPLVSVFARHAPHQKEAVVAAFNHGGFRTLMVGDGTNDVGALKRAHVGISIISAPDVEAKQRDASETMSRIRRKKKSESPSSMMSKQKKKEQRQMLERSLEQLREAQEELDHVELGDASVAAPFTSRAVSIKCVKDIIQQGRCTLVTMLQIYKILGINCLVNAMVLSNLFLHGVKQGDRQLTILGMAVASLFFFVTQAEPLPTLSVERPPSSVLCVQALVSIALQFAVHLLTIYLATEASLLWVDPYDPSLVPDGRFNPNVLNSCTFLLTCVATINTFAVNYRGSPFMQDLPNNKLLYRSLQVSYAVLAICALQIFPPLNDLLQLTTLSAADEGYEDRQLEEVTQAATAGAAATATGASMDSVPSLAVVANLVAQLVKRMGLSWFIFGLLVLDTVLAFAVERWCRHLL